MGSQMVMVYYTVLTAAIGTMLTALVVAVRLRRLTRGGKIGRIVNLLASFILIFLAGYLVAPFIPQLPLGASLLLVGFVFLFGAIFVVLVLHLIERLVRQVFEDLKI